MIRSALQKGRTIRREKGALSMLGSASDFGGKLIGDCFRFAAHDIEAARKFDVPLRTRMRAWRHGFHTKTWVWVGLDDDDPDEYVNNVVEQRAFRKINGWYRGVFGDKVAFYLASRDFHDNLPDHYGVIEDGRFRPFEGEASLLELISEVDNVIAKPICGAQGDGVRLLRREELSDEEIEALESELDEYLVMEFVEQHQYASNISPESANTVRFYTIIDPETGSPHIMRAIHRFGTERSAPTDNWSTGGMCASIDAETGVMTEAFAQDDDEGMVPVDRHPETEVRIDGTEIPYWDETRELILDAASHHSRAPLIGWDVIITDDGPVIIEANDRPDIDMNQMSEGLLTDEVARRFFETLSIYG